MRTRLPDPGALPAQLANRILDREDWARERLAPFAGRVFTLAVGPLVSALRVRTDGTLETAELAGNADLRLTLSPFAVPAFLATPRRWNDFVHEDGDTELGGALKELAQTLPWFVEQALAQALGPVVGQRLADTGRALLAFPAYAAEQAGDSFASYARDEAGLLARAGEMREFAQESTAVTARVDRLEARLAALERAGTPPA